MNQLIKFQEHSIEILNINGRPALTAEAVGIVLGYTNPRNSVVNIIIRNHNNFLSSENFMMTPKKTKSGVKGTYILFVSGIAEIIGKSHGPHAKFYRRWAVHVLSTNVFPADSSAEWKDFYYLETMIYYLSLRDQVLGKLLSECRRQKS